MSRISVRKCCEEGHVQEGTFQAKEIAHAGWKAQSFFEEHSSYRQAGKLEESGSR